MAFNPSVSYGIQGQLVQWTRVIRNTGSSTSNSVKMTLNIPSILGHNSYSVTKGSYNPLTKIWTVGALGSNEQATISIYFLTNAAPSGDLTLNSVLSGTGTDINLGNNEANDILEYAPIETPNIGFQVNEQTAYVSNFRNLNNSIGMPVVGDISKVFNPNTSGFNWTTFTNGLFSNVYFFKGNYTGNVLLNNKTIEAGFSVFQQLEVEQSVIVDIEDVLNTLNVKNGSTLFANKVTGNINLSGAGSSLILNNLNGFLFMTGNVNGRFNITADTVSSAATFKASTTVAPVFTGYTTINIKIKSLDNIFTISNIDLSGVNLNINIESTTERGKLKFDGITVNDDTNIVVSGNFYDDGNTEFFGYPQILIENTTNSGTLPNRINIVNSAFYTVSSQSISISLNAIGVNINGCHFKTRGTAVISTANTEIYLANSITNDIYSYDTDPHFLGSIIQDIDY